MHRDLKMELFASGKLMLGRATDFGNESRHLMASPSSNGVVYSSMYSETPMTKREYNQTFV